MKNTKLISILFLSIISWSSQAQTKNIVSNPINLNYRFQVDEPSRREAADPVLEYFNGKYYLFASVSGGYWSSPDLVEWSYIPCKTIDTIEEYAPSILVLNDTLYFIASNSPRIFYTTNPDIDDWRPVNAKFEYDMTDPAFFKDDDTGKVYLYWGCSDKDPIMGVEIDPSNGFKSIGTPVKLIEHNPEKHGWEVPGKNNDADRNGWNEGPCMNKHNGKYYLQYAAPGTEYRIYGDGVYVGDNPLGPLTYMENSPFSFKPGGFIGGAGHSHTFQDKYGNYWRVSTMVKSVRHKFERRLGLFPAYFSEDGTMHTHAVWTDYPFYIPDHKADFETNNCSMNWNLLSYNKPTSASSSLPEFDSKYANDEQIETWWSAQTGNIGEWWQIDLGKTMEVNAIQVNFADQDFTNRASNSYVFYQYCIEISDDGQKWEPFIDRTQNMKDMPHELIVSDNPQKARYIRITNTKDMEGKFSLSGFRVFGSEGGELPEKVSGIQVQRNENDKRRFLLNWDGQANVTGYIVRWGVKKDELKSATMVFTNQLEGGFFNRDSPYYFSIDAFNENGVTHPVRIGIDGLIHDHVNGLLSNLSRFDIQIVGIAEKDKDLVQRYAKQYGFDMSIVYSTVEEMIEKTKPEAVCAFNSIYDHLHTVEVCAPKGIHVMVEKPLAVNSEHANKMAELSRKHNTYLLTNYETTWYPSNHEAYKMVVTNHEIGDIRKVIVCAGHKGPKEIGCSQEFLDWLTDPVLNGGGAVIDFGCYGANLITWLMQNEEPLSVSAVLQQIKPEIYPKVDDEATIILTYPKAQAIIQASWNWPIGRKDMEIYGVTGYVKALNSTDFSFRLTEEKPEIQEKLSPLPALENEPFGYFANVIRGKVKVATTDLSSLENNLIVVKILDAARKSVKENAQK